MCRTTIDNCLGRGQIQQSGLICSSLVELITSSSNFDQLNLDAILAIITTKNYVFINVTNACPRFLQSFEPLDHNTDIGRWLMYTSHPLISIHSYYSVNPMTFSRSYLLKFFIQQPDFCHIIPKQHWLSVVKELFSILAPSPQRCLLLSVLTHIFFPWYNMHAFYGYCLLQTLCSWPKEFTCRSKRILLKSVTNSNKIND